MVDIFFVDAERRLDPEYVACSGPSACNNTVLEKSNVHVSSVDTCLLNSLSSCFKSKEKTLASNFLESLGVLDARLVKSFFEESRRLLAIVSEVIFLHDFQDSPCSSTSDRVRAVSVKPHLISERLSDRSARNDSSNDANSIAHALSNSYHVRDGIVLRHLEPKESTSTSIVASLYFVGNANSACFSDFFKCFLHVAMIKREYASVTLKRLDYETSNLAT